MSDDPRLMLQDLMTHIAKDVGVQKLKSALEKAREIILSQQDQITALQQERAAPNSVLYCTAIHVTSNSLVVSMDGRMIELRTTEHVKDEVKPGEPVAINPDMSYSHAVIPELVQHGHVVTISRIVSDTTVEVATEHGGTRVVFRGVTDVHPEDRVVLDPGGQVVIKNLGQAQGRYQLHSNVNVQWDSIIGQEAAVKAMIEAVEWPLLHKDRYAAYGKEPLRGVLVYGDPGCGKTMLGRASATAVGRLYQRNGKAVDGGFFYMKGPEVLDQFVGNAEGRIRQVFAQARRFKKQHGYPAVLFIDEADAILGRRGDRGAGGMEKTIVPSFLSETDGIDASDVLVILATNRPDSLDEAVVRDGRISRKIHVPRPGKADVAKLFEHYLAKIPFRGDLDANSAAKLASEQVFNDRQVVQSYGDVVLRLSNIVSGAMVAGIVDKATSLAITREIEAGTTETGLIAADLTGAIRLTCQENSGVEHRSEVLKLVGEHVKLQIMMQQANSNGGGSGTVVQN